MATIESIIKQVATEHFEGFTYLFDIWMDADAKLEKLQYPAIVCIMPTRGQVEWRNGRFYDMENIALAFLDLAPRNAEGEDNMEVVDRMKLAGAQFIHKLNQTRQLEPINKYRYDVICEKLATIVSGAMYELEVKKLLGECAT